MAEEMIVVERTVQGKFGAQVQLQTGEYYSLGKFCKDEFVNGQTYKVDIYTSPKGYKYINKVISNGYGQLEEKPIVKRGRKPKVDVPFPTGGVAEVVAVAQALQPKLRDFDAEARGKTRCALLEALYSNPVVELNNKEKLQEMVEWGVQLVFGDK